MEWSLLDEELKGLVSRLKPDQLEMLEKVREYRLKMCGFDLDDPSGEWMNSNGKDHEKYLLMNRKIIYEEVTRNKNDDYSKTRMAYLFVIGILIACHLGWWVGHYRPRKKRQLTELP